MGNHTSNRLARSLNSIQLSKLHTFETAARLGSFALAANELCLTPSAVSHQMSKLEKELGLSLFARQHRKISLTSEGQQLYTTVSSALNQITNEIGQVQSGKVSGALTLYSRPSFTHDWLTPRLGEFCRQYPSIEIKLLTGNETLDLNRHNIDLAVYYSHLAPDAEWSLKLCEEQVIPVCSPEYAARHKLSPHCVNLSDCVLLHDNQAWHTHSHLDEWKFWQEKHTEFEISHCQSVGFDQSSLAVKAAKYGAGLAMGRWSLVKEDILAGILVTPLTSEPIPSGFYYYLIAPQQTLPSRQHCFVDWVKKQLEEEQ